MVDAASTIFQGATSVSGLRPFVWSCHEGPSAAGRAES